MPVLFSKLFHGAVLTVVLLRHFHDIHETTRGDRQGDGRWESRLVREFTELVSVPERERNMVMVP